METTIISQIIELCLFLVLICLSALVKRRPPRSVFVRVLIVSAVAIAIVSWILLEVYDVITFIIGS